MAVKATANKQNIIVSIIDAAIGYDQEKKLANGQLGGGADARGGEKPG